MLLQLPDCLPGLLTGEDDRLAVRHPNVAQVKQEPGTAAQPAPQQDTQVSHASSILTCVQVGALIYIYMVQRHSTSVAFSGENIVFAYIF